MALERESRSWLPLNGDRKLPFICQSHPECYYETGLDYKGIEKIFYIYIKKGKKQCTIIYDRCNKFIQTKTKMPEIKYSEMRQKK